MRAWNGGRETHWAAGCCFSLYLKPCFQVSQVRPCQLKSPWGCKGGAPQKWPTVQWQESWPQRSLVTSPVACWKAGWWMWEKSWGYHDLLRRAQWLIKKNKGFSSIPNAETLPSIFPPISPVLPEALDMPEELEGGWLASLDRWWNWNQREQESLKSHGNCGSSLVVQWIWTFLPMQATRVWYLVWKIPHVARQLSLQLLSLQTHAS